MIRWLVRAGWAAGLAGLAVLTPAELGAQDPPSLDSVAALSADGRVSRARSALESWWDARWSDAPDPERQRALWLRGTLALDPSTARRDYMRLVLEHPGGRRSADALLRLAQADAVAGRIVAAARHYEQLLREYPDSPHRLEARRWLDEHRREVARARAEAERAAAENRDGGPDGDAAADTAADSGAGAEPGADAPDEPAAADGADAAEEEEEPAAERPAGDDEAAGAGRGPVSVQLGAFSTEERARRLVRSARGEGISGLRLVRVEGSDLIRVRAGRFPSREAAGALRSRIEDRGFSTAIVTDADRERPIQ